MCSVSLSRPSRLSLTALGSLQMGAEIGQGPLDAIHAAILGRRVEPTHHLVARLLDLAGQGLGEFLQAGRFLPAAAALGLDQTAVQIGEGLFQLGQ